MSVRKYSKQLDAVIVRTTFGEDWVGYESVDGAKIGCMSKQTWDNLEDAALEPVGEWPYDQEG